MALSGSAWGSACIRWSATQSVSSPTSSAARATARSVGGIAPGGPCQEKLVTLMLTFIEERSYDITCFDVNLFGAVSSAGAAGDPSGSWSGELWPRTWMEEETDER